MLTASPRLKWLGHSQAGKGLAVENMVAKPSIMAVTQSFASRRVFASRAQASPHRCASDYREVEPAMETVRHKRADVKGPTTQSSA